MRTPEHRPVPDPDAAHRSVVRRYTELAQAARAGQRITDCDGEAFSAGCFGSAAYADTADASVLPDRAVDSSLGCGNPVAVADLVPGEVVLDLGSGGGIDVLLSARRVAPGGLVYGLDASAEMVDLARANAEQAGAGNVRFLHGRIEAVPLPDEHVDAVISNCVINLSPDKPAAFAEAYRVLRPGGRLGISDVLGRSGATADERVEAEQRVGCTVGTLTADEYRELLRAAGFIEVRITPASDAQAAAVYSAVVRAAKP
jgi:ubiquinone/menaquinone biosynthesis C-methylase UbiE